MKTTTTGYQIKYVDGRNDPKTYASLDDAAEAVRTRCGWSQVVVSEPYTIDGGREGVSVFATAAECVADSDGSHAPRIEEVAAL